MKINALLSESIGVNPLREKIVGGIANRARATRGEEAPTCWH